LYLKFKKYMHTISLIFDNIFYFEHSKL
jgi:hypothetical protein